METPESELNGIDFKLLKNFRQGDISWFPLHRTKLISQIQDEEALLKSKIEAVENRLDGFIGLALNLTPQKVTKIWNQTAFVDYESKQPRRLEGHT